MITLIKDLIYDALLVLNDITNFPLQEGRNAPNFITEMCVEYDHIIRVDGRGSSLHQRHDNRMTVQRLQSQRHAVGGGANLNRNLLSLYNFLLFVTLDDLSNQHLPDRVHVQVAQDGLLEYLERHGMSPHPPSCKHTDLSEPDHQGLLPCGLQKGFRGVGEGRSWI